MNTGTYYDIIAKNYCLLPVDFLKLCTDFLLLLPALGVAGLGGINYIWIWIQHFQKV